MIKCTLVLMLFVGLSGYVRAQENIPNPEDVLKKVSGVIDVPGLDKINASEITAGLEKAEEKLREKCNNNGGPDAYDKAKDASKDMEVCLRSLVNVTEMQTEMEIAKPKGDLDIVFKKYCQRSPILKECITNFTVSIEPCLEEKERESKKYIQNITESLLGFICFKEGDRIALFISTGGPECFQSKQQQLVECGNSTFGSYITQLQDIAKQNGGALPGPESLPKLTFEHEQCTKIANFQTCVVSVLETCQDPTPANIVESILNFVKRATPCERLLKASTRSASGLEVAASSASDILSSLLVTISVFLMIRYM